MNVWNFSEVRKRLAAFLLSTPSIIAWHQKSVDPAKKRYYLTVEVTGETNVEQIESAIERLQQQLNELR